ncbi:MULTISPECIES: hypothetical protein [Sporosarcina]|uniref:hypothetical protein n=1 Tax=Sporosarcina TaxID=1569 RepID=UPI00069391EA|nr:MULTISPECIES: hypothetical protein [Sporosarcina]WJY28469.1 hypothetical protein QWT68_05660 [Sporosarcina sp. 0.2-SM1T-5]
MMRQLMQLAGVICLTAGAVLFFTAGDPVDDQASVKRLTAENSELKRNLSSVKETLADAQKATQAEKKQSASPNTSSGKAPLTEAAKEQTPEKETVTKMIISLSPGDTSKDASDALETAGIVKSASEFEGYLNKEGLSGKIQIGRHEVDSSMDFAQLAKELTTVRQ